MNRQWSHITIPNRRQRIIRILPDGSWFDEDVWRDYLAALDKRAPKRETVERPDRILGFIEDYMAEHGYAPSVREIGRAMGLASTSAVHYWLTKLRKEGRIKWDPEHARTLTLPRPTLDDLTVDRLELAWCLSVHGSKPPKVRPCKRHRIMAEWLTEIVIPRAVGFAA